MKQLTVDKIFKSIPPKLTKFDTVSLDLELSGLSEDQLHRPNGSFLSLACSFDGINAYIIFDPKEIQPFLDAVSEATWIFHNSTFDLAHLRRWAVVDERTNLRDTMLIEKLMWSDYYSDFALNDLVRRYLGCYMPKDVRAEFSDHSGEMTEEQIQYAGLDAVGTWLVDRAQQNLRDSKGELVFSKHDHIFWEKVDLPNVWTSIQMSGFMVDKEKWLDLAERNQTIVDRIEEELGKKYGKEIEKVKHTRRLPSAPKHKVIYNDDGDYEGEEPPTKDKLAEYEAKLKAYHASKLVTMEFIPFNPASPAQVLAILNARGIHVASTGDDEIRPFIHDEFVATILEYRKAAKKVSTYGADYMKFVEADGRIYPSLNVIGTATGRNSCRSPNLQQIPRDKEYRECFIAGKGRKLIIADYSAQEPRIFASICQDAKLIEIFQSGKDIYCEIARVAFRETITKADKERRNQIKALVLGLIYGLTPFGFARDNEVELEVAEDMYNIFFETFPQAAAWVKEQQRVNKKFTRTVLGRKCHLHPYNPEWKNNSLNNPMQGSGADMTKLAMKKFGAENRELIRENKVGIILPVHDEVIVWCLEELAEQTKISLETCMISVAELIHVGIPAIVEAHVADSWAEK